MMHESDRRYLDQLREQTIDGLRSAFDVSKPVAILDFPIHTNVGDHMIYAGERAYLQRMGVEVRYVSDVRRFDPSILRQRLGEGTVLIHGGGNFGDIWLDHQQFREDVAAVLTSHPIVQLPQSIYYRDKSRAAVADSILGSHPDFKLLVRDTPSLNRAVELLPSVPIAYVPDMALGWTPEQVDSGASPERKTLVLARTDREAASGLENAISNLPVERNQVVDWTMTSRERWSYRAARGPSKLSNGVGERFRRRALNDPIRRSYDVINRVNLQCGVRMFLGAQSVVTDRLHAHVLATLLGIPNVALNNDYGKVKAVWDDYTGRFSTSHFANDVRQVEAILERIRHEAAV